MAISGEFFGPKLQIQALQSVVPTNPTDPRISTTVHLHQNPATFPTVLLRRFHVLLCYDRLVDQDSGWHAAGWIKESLGMALADWPLVAGRLRRQQDGDLEIVANDSGVRLVEAMTDFKMDEFLELKEKDEAGAELVFWEDVSEQNPQFCPMFFVQVTNFSCGGYSIGITCSLLVMDPFALTNFIKRWAHIHKRCIVQTTDSPKLPTFYLPSIGIMPGASRPLQTGSNSSKTCAKSVTFKTKLYTKLDSEVAKNLAELCIDKVESEIGAKMGSDFSLFVKGTSEDDAKFELCKRQGVSDNINGVECVRTLWDDELSLDSACFNNGDRKPAYSTSWINSVFNQGSVMILPSTFDGTKIVVTFT